MTHLQFAVMALIHIPKVDLERVLAMGELANGVHVQSQINNRGLLNIE
jgi:hypothetical protein